MRQLYDGRNPKVGTSEAVGWRMKNVFVVVPGTTWREADLDSGRSSLERTRLKMEI